MAYYCKKCLNVFDDDFVKSYIRIYGETDLFCPIRTCSRADFNAEELSIGELVEVDENILEAVLILNKKGYRTVESCSGHLTGSLTHTYIEFVGNYNFDTIPKDFKVEIYKDTTVIAKGFSGVSDKDRQEEIWNTAKDILNWAEALPVSEKN